MKFQFIKKGVTLLLLFVSVSLSAQQPQLPPLPIDPQIRYGVLDNGLTYYIRANKKPKERAEFYIAQKVGAILEEDSQNGLAHFLEHMAFNGTKNFPDKGIIHFLERQGVKFGENINAYTALDETVYNLSDVPTNKEEVIDTALLVLHDWSNSLLLQGDEIDLERGVIREEWRTRANANRRMWTAANKILFKGSQYAKRDVIGDTAVINNFDYDVLRNYYKKWYRPDLQAILVVGDIDVEKVEKKIKSIFADIPKPVNPAERIIYPVLPNKEPIVAVVTDPEATMTLMEIQFRQEVMPPMVKKSQLGYLAILSNSLLRSIVAERFGKITQRPDAPFVASYANFEALTKSKDVYRWLVVPKEGIEKEAFQALLYQIEKLKKYGVTNAELERAKKNMLQSFKKAYNERETQLSGGLVKEYVRHFLDDEPIPGIEKEYELVQTFLPRITKTAIDQMAKSLITKENIAISIKAPEKETILLPTKTEVVEMLLAAKDMKIDAPEEETVNKALMPNKPKPGNIKKMSKNEALNFTEIMLDNGVKVALKTTDYMKDEILCTAHSYGGFSKVKNIADLPSATNAVSIVVNNGLGDFDAIELQKVLTGKIANASPYISKYSEGFSGSSSVEDLETMLQLIYLYFTAPRKDDDAFQAFINNSRTMLANAEKNPRKAFSDSISVTLFNHDPRNILESLEMLEQIDQDKAMKIYKERFANPADFTFIFVGNIDPNDSTTQALLNTYLGGLKTNIGQTERYDTPYHPIPKGQIYNLFTQEMQVKKASNFIAYSGEMKYNFKNSITMSIIGDLLSMYYLESIREKEGGSYGVGVRGGVNNIPSDRALLYMQFDTDPEKQGKLMKIIHQEVQRMIHEGPDAEKLAKVKDNLRKNYAEDTGKNGWWRSTIALYYQDGINAFADYPDLVDSIDANTIVKTLKKLVKQNNVIEVVMSPK